MKWQRNRTNEPRARVTRSFPTSGMVQRGAQLIEMALAKRFYFSSYGGFDWSVRYASAFVFSRMTNGKRNYMMTFLISSYMTSTMAPPVPRSTLENAPLKKAAPPSVLAMVDQQWMVLLYTISVFLRPDCIIIRLRTVSKG